MDSHQDDGDAHASGQSFKATGYPFSTFLRVILEVFSGEALGTADDDDWGLTQALMDKTGAKNMDDLMAIPEDELIEIYTAPDEEGNCLNDLYNMPLRGEGSIIPEDPYQALKDGAAKDVIMMIGTNSDEWRYWVNEMGDVEMSEMDDDGIAENMAMYEEYVAQEKYDSAMAAATSGEKSK